MIIVPELKVVVLLVPRTGSGSLYRALLKTYPRAFMLYRHMEADGVPVGYNAWLKIGVVRHPIDRLFSFYKFCKTFGEGKNFGGNGLVGRHSEFEINVIRKSVERPFEDWLLNNQVPFAYEPNMSDIGGHPIVSQLHYCPENRKSQFIYLRPDLGTEIHQFSDLTTVEHRLDITLNHYNSSPPSDMPGLSRDAWAHMERYFEWDFKAVGGK